MLPLLRRSILAKALVLQPRAPLFPTLKIFKAFSTTPIRRDDSDAMDVIFREFAENAKFEREHGDGRYRSPGTLPVNPPYEHVTVDNMDLQGTTTLPNGDPIGFDTSAEGLTPEEAYWFGVQGWQDHEDAHHNHELGWHVDLDGFLRVDERGPHQDMYNGGWYFDLPGGGKRYLEGT